MGKKGLRHEVRTPDAKEITGGKSGPAPMRLHIWFDHKRNVMVVEVEPEAEETPPRATLRAKAVARPRSDV